MPAAEHHSEGAIWQPNSQGDHDSRWNFSRSFPQFTVVSESHVQRLSQPSYA